MSSNQGREEALSELNAVDRDSREEPSDLEELAKTAFLTGKGQAGADLLSLAHKEYLEEGRVCDAARCAFWLGFTALLNGESAQANGWQARAERLLSDQPDCVEKGYLLVPAGYRGMHSGDVATSIAAFERVAEIGRRFSDRDLTTLGLQGQGRALIRGGEVRHGVTLLDEAMIAVTAGEVSPLVAGGVYCSVIEGCGEIFDMRRAQEWTTALEQWCESQPDVVPYRGHCRLRRSEILELHGAWTEAMDEALRANASFGPERPDGAAMYRIAELHRLRGEFTEAETAYKQAVTGDRSQPGYALLRLAQGDIDGASAAIRRLLAEVHEPTRRVRVLVAYVEIILAANEVGDARDAAQQLSDLATRYDSPLLHALSERATGAVFLADQDPTAALPHLRRSWTLFKELDAPYEIARTRVLVALTYFNLKDEDAAISEMSLARQLFQQLGAVSDLERSESMLRKRPSVEQCPLTEREVEVLRLIASGITNRGIATKLHISEKTVARHVSNIFVKLDLPSRAAATAYAFQHQLV